MHGDRKNWPIIIGVTAGVMTGLVAGFYLYSSRSHHEPDEKLRDATDIIAQCHEKIREIENNLETLKKPLSV
ncbi:MAG: hypothetical protein ACYC27_13490 [Armatimonadota bacterium]